MKNTVRSIALSVLSSTFLLTTPAWSTDADEDDDLDPAIAPEDCVNLRRVRSTEVISDTTIIFRVSGGKIYRNILPRKCPGLKRAGSFIYKTTMSRLCHVDTIAVLDSFGGGFRSGPSCGLGKFYPISEDEAALLEEGGPPPKEPEPVERPDDGSTSPEIDQDTTDSRSR